MLLRCRATTPVCYYAAVLLPRRATTPPCYYAAVLLRRRATTPPCYYAAVLLRRRATTPPCYYATVLLVYMLHHTCRVPHPHFYNDLLFVKYSYNRTLFLYKWSKKEMCKLQQSKSPLLEHIFTFIHVLESTNIIIYYYYTHAYLENVTYIINISAFAYSHLDV